MNQTLNKIKVLTESINPNFQVSWHQNSVTLSFHNRETKETKLLNIDINTWERLRQTRLISQVINKTYTIGRE